MLFNVIMGTLSWRVMSCAVTLKKWSSTSFFKNYFLSARMSIQISVPIEMLKVAAHSSWSALPPVVTFLVSGAFGEAIQTHLIMKMKLSTNNCTSQMNLRESEQSRWNKSAAVVLRLTETQDADDFCKGWPSVHLGW
jgi:hypothetical protein